MKEIIAPIERGKIMAELTPERFLRHTNKGGNEKRALYHARNRPSAGNRIPVGRRRNRERSRHRHVRHDGETLPTTHRMGSRCKRNIGRLSLHTGRGHAIRQRRPDYHRHFPHFSPKFIREYMPHTIELGRSFVSLEYQSTRSGAKGLFALDNLWDGLGALVVIYPQIKYFFGKVTMYPTFSIKGRNMILYFLNKHFADTEKLVWPRTPLETNSNYEELQRIFPENNSFKEDYKILNQEVRALGFNIPPLVNSYMSLSPTMRMFGTAINDEFGDVEESGILIAIDEILEEKKKRHIDTYER